jgi:hypothetical protein
MKFIKTAVNKINNSVQNETVLKDSGSAVLNGIANVAFVVPSVGLAGIKKIAKSVNERSDKICEWTETKTEK